MLNYKLPKLFDRNGDLSKRWYVGYYFKHPETNRYELFQIWISSRLLTKSARYSRANEIKKEWSTKLKSGFNPYADQTTRQKTIIESLDFILNIKERTTKKRTYQTYKSIIKTFKKWLEQTRYSNISADSFTKIHAQEYFDYLIQTTQISGRTHNNILTGIKTIFNDLYHRELILRNPFKNVKRLPEIQPGINSYSIHELKSMKAKISQSNPGLWLFCEFVFYCGIRPAELVRLKIRDIDLSKSQLIVQASNSKNNKAQIVSIPDPLIQSLIIYGYTKLNEGHFLFSSGGKPGIKQVAAVRYSEMFRNEANQIGFDKSRKLYDLKHTAAGMVIENGGNINDLKTHLRHHDISVTNKYLQRFKSGVSKDFLNKFPTF